MKPVQIMMDEDLLRSLDKDEDVRALGRSEVFRRMTRDYLRRTRERKIVEAYRRAYADHDGLVSDFDGWEEEGSWPND